MFLYINSNGKIVEQITDRPFREGDNGNTIYFICEQTSDVDGNKIGSASCRFQFSDGSYSKEHVLNLVESSDTNAIISSSLASKNNLKFFTANKNYVEDTNYIVFKFAFPSYYCVDGVCKGSITEFFSSEGSGDSYLSSGLFTFSIESSVVEFDSEYEYFISFMESLANKFDWINFDGTTTSYADFVEKYKPLWEETFSQTFSGYFGLKDYIDFKTKNNGGGSGDIKVAYINQENASLDPSIWQNASKYGTSYTFEGITNTADLSIDDVIMLGGSVSGDNPDTTHARIIYVGTIQEKTDTTITCTCLGCSYYPIENYDYKSLIYIGFDLNNAAVQTTIQNQTGISEVSSYGFSDLNKNFINTIISYATAEAGTNKTVSNLVQVFLRDTTTGIYQNAVLYPVNNDTYNGFIVESDDFILSFQYDGGTNGTNYWIVTRKNLIDYSVDSTTNITLINTVNSYVVPNIDTGKEPMIIVENTWRVPRSSFSLNLSDTNYDITMCFEYALKYTYFSLYSFLWDRGSANTITYSELETGYFNFKYYNGFPYKNVLEKIISMLNDAVPLNYAVRSIAVRTTDGNFYTGIYNDSTNALQIFVNGELSNIPADSQVKVFLTDMNETTD